MCPDRDLVSAYIDGEVPSPWRERLEEHFASCAGCAAIAAGYTDLGARLRADVAGESAALERGRSRLESLLSGMEASVEAPLRLEGAAVAGGAPEAWKRRISLPLPFAAAAAVLVLALGGATALLAFKPAKGPTIQAVASGELAPRSQAGQSQSASMDELLRYLNSSDGQVTLTINLPTGTTFGSAGKPVIMRSSQALRGTPVGDSAP